MSSSDPIEVFLDLVFAFLETFMVGERSRSLIVINDMPKHIIWAVCIHLCKAHTLECLINVRIERNAKLCKTLLKYLIQLSFKFRL